MDQCLFKKWKPSMVNKYIVYQAAVDDFERIVQYITYSINNPEGASKLVELFESKVRFIMNFPYSYPIIYDSKLEKSNLRKCKMDHYLVIYIFNEKLDQIEIVRILYQREDYLLWFLNTRNDFTKYHLIKYS